MLCLRLPSAALLVAACSTVVVAQTQSVSISSATVTINPAATDTYSIKGTFSGISASGAQAFVFSVGQFGAPIPLSAFVQKPGTNVYQYQDTTGSTPYWLSSLTMDLDANQFTATANGVILSGLPNPLAVRVGTDSGSACSIVRLQTTSPGTYQLNPADPVGIPCSMPYSPIADPPLVPVATASQVKISVDATGLDAKSAMLFVADDNAQPIGDPLCTLSDNGDGTSSCTVSLNESNPGIIPLLIQATSGGEPVLAPGSLIQVVAPVSSSDAQQVSAVENLVLSAGAQARGQYGDSVQARVQVMAAVRQYFNSPATLSSQRVGLTAYSSELDVICDSGHVVVYNLSPLDPSTTADSVPAQASLAASAKPASATPRPAVSQPLGYHRASATPPQQCGDFSRDIVENDQVLVWDPGSLFFGAQDAAPNIAKVLQDSKCPNFNVRQPVTGSEATAAIFSEFRNYGTVIMNTHGGVNRFGRFFLVTGESTLSPNDEGSKDNPIQLGSWCDDTIPGCFVTVYANYNQLHISPYTFVYGGFCNGFKGKIPPLPGNLPLTVYSQWPKALAPDTSSDAFFGFNYPVYTTVNQAAGKAIFNSLVNDYSSTSGAIADALEVAPNVEVYPTTTNLAYVGNPHLATNLAGTGAPPPYYLSAYLDGTASCGKNGAPYMNVQWMNPAQAGHLTPDTPPVNGLLDNFTNLATQSLNAFLPVLGHVPHLTGLQAVAIYTPNSSQVGLTDDVTALFLPDPANPPAAKACIDVSGIGLFVEDQLATSFTNLLSFIPMPVEISPPQKITSTYTVSTPPGSAGTASVTVTPNGGNDYSLTISVGGAYPNNGYASIDLSALNPGAAGKAHVQISGQFDMNTQAELAACAGKPTCNFPDGTVLINGGATADIGILDPKALPFTVTADSSSSPVDIYVGMQTNISSSTNSVFTLQIDIKFLMNQ